MRNLGTISVLTIIALFLLIPSAQSATLDVCGSGCNSTTIQGAIDLASSGDTIEVGDGTYNENIILNVTNLTLVSDEFVNTGSTTANTTLINGGGIDKIPVTIEADGVIFQGFTVFNYRWGVYVDDVNATIDNCIIYDTGVYYVETPRDYEGNRGIVAHLTQASSSSVTITNNLVFDNWRGDAGHPSSRMNMAGRGISVGSDVFGVNNSVLIDSNEVYGSDQSGIYARKMQATITNNYVHDCGFDGLDEMQWCVGIMIAYSEGTTLIENNTIERIKAPWTQYGSISSGGIIMYGATWTEDSHYGLVKINNNTIDTGSASAGINVHNPSDDDWDIYITNNTVSGTTADPRGLLPTWGGIHLWNTKRIYSILNPSLFADIYTCDKYTTHVDAIEGNIVKDNEIGIVMNDSEVASFKYNSIYDNTEYDMDVDEFGAEVIATNNWWGSATLNISKLFGNVTYYPFCLDAECTENIDDEITEFAGDNTTDFSAVTNWSCVDLCLDADDGTINWTSPASLCGCCMKFDECVSISHNIISVDSSIMPELNQSAELTFKDSEYTDTSQFNVYKDGIPCSPTICTGISVVGENVTVDVTQFSNYSIVSSLNISTCQELQNISNNLTADYQLLNDIDCAGFSWTPIDNFAGNLNGNNYTIENENISCMHNNCGLFSNVMSSSIYYLNIDSFTTNGNNNTNIGNLIGVVHDSNIHHVNVYNSNITNSKNAGILFGNVYNSTLHDITLYNLEMNNCIETEQGGIAGFVEDSNIYNVSINYSKVYLDNMNHYSGMFFGKISKNVTIDNSSVSNPIIIVNGNDGGTYGGFFGYADGIENEPIIIRNSFVQNITVNSVNDDIGDFGGFMGMAEKYVEIYDSYVNGGNINGNISGLDSCQGGFAYWTGNNLSLSEHTIIKRCWSTNLYMHSNCIFSFTVISYGSHISECYANNTQNSTGGASDSANVGFVSFIKNSTIENSYSLSTLYGNGIVTGFVQFGVSDYGYYDNYTNNYFAGTSQSYDNKIYGFSSDVYSHSYVDSNNYWDTDKSGVLNSNDGTGKTTSDMVLQATFTNWDFSSVWKINETNSYPYFQWQTDNIPMATVNSIPPQITVYSPTNTTYTSANITLQVSADETVDTWTYDLNGVNSTFTPNTTFVCIGGANTIIIYANDSFGNLNSSTVHFTYRESTSGHSPGVEEEEEEVPILIGVDMCIPNWNCTEWGECINGIAERECIDTAECESEFGMPPTETVCTMIFDEATNETTVIYATEGIATAGYFLASGNYAEFLAEIADQFTDYYWTPTETIADIFLMKWIISLGSFIGLIWVGRSLIKISGRMKYLLWVAISIFVSILIALLIPSV